MAAPNASKKAVTKEPISPVLPCVECRAKCCSYVAVELDKPTCKRDYEHIRWYLLHKNVKVFVDHEGDWFVEFETVCEALGDDYLCGIYETRPKICRDHGWPLGTCEYFADPYRHCWHTAKEFEQWMDRKKIDWRFKR